MNSSSVISESITEEYLRYILDIVSNGDIFGSKVFIGAGVPDPSKGIEGDIWIDTINRFVYQYNTTWVFKFNLGTHISYEANYNGYIFEC